MNYNISNIYPGFGHSKFKAWVGIQMTRKAYPAYAYTVKRVQRQASLDRKFILARSIFPLKIM